MHDRDDEPGEGGGLGCRGHGGVVIELEEHRVEIHSAILINLQGNRASSTLECVLVVR